jgi:hypothetical protein
VLCFTSSNRQVHSEGIQGQHAASFPIRVGGKMLVALFDIGAACSLMHADTARSLGLTIKPCLDQRITGVGGSSSVIGIVSISVKIGKSYSDHQFVILETPIAGYGVLVGQDFMQQVGCAILHHFCRMRLRNWYGSKASNCKKSTSLGCTGME